MFSEKKEFGQEPFDLLNPVLAESEHPKVQESTPDRPTHIFFELDSEIALPEKGEHQDYFSRKPELRWWRNPIDEQDRLCVPPIDEQDKEGPVPVDRICVLKGTPEDEQMFPEVCR